MKEQEEKKNKAFLLVFSDLKQSPQEDGALLPSLIPDMELCPNYGLVCHFQCDFPDSTFFCVISGKKQTSRTEHPAQVIRGTEKKTQYALFY